MMKIKQGPHFNLVPRKVYAYVSLKACLSKLCSQKDFLQKCKHWRHRNGTPGYYTDVYDGEVWKAFQIVDGDLFLQWPNNLCLKLNLDWFNPFEHIKYSVGVLYFDRKSSSVITLQIENIIIVGTLPRPKELKNINPFFQPIID